LKETCNAMNKDKHQAAIDALSELMRSELDCDSRGRFACVNRLAVLAQKLQIEMNPRPEDMDEQQNEYGINVADHGIIRGGGAMGAAMYGGDQAQMAREMLAMIGPAMGGLQGNNEAKKRESMARELNELLDARNRFLFGTGAQDPEAVAAAARLTKRINVLTELVSQEEEEEKPHAQAPELHVVPAVDVRRHQAGEGHGQGDAPHARRALPDGEGGREGALREGGEAGGLQEGVDIGDGAA
jgi:hypothetical protein